MQGVRADARAPAILACAPLALVLADARAPALLAMAPLALVRADARAPALLAIAPDALVLTDARPPALLACAPLALVLADARAPALLAFTPDALVLADARAPAVLAFVPPALVRAETARLLVLALRLLRKPQGQRCRRASRDISMLTVCIVLSMRLNLELDSACVFAASKSLFMPWHTHIVWKCSLAYIASLVLFGHLTSQASSVCTQNANGETPRQMRTCTHACKHTHTERNI